MHAESTQAGGTRPRLTIFIVFVIAGFSLLLLYLFMYDCQILLPPGMPRTSCLPVLNFRTII